MRFATDDEVTNWDQLIATNPNRGDILYTNEFASLKSSTGWTPRYIIGAGFTILALEKTIPLLGRYWYLPKGPGVSSPEQLASCVTSLREFAAGQHVFAVTIEPEITDTGSLSASRLIPIAKIQPNSSTVIIDLTPSEDDILASFGQTARRMIRKAEKEPGIRIEPVEATDANCHTMYDLYRETADGQFGTHEYEYHRQYWQSYAANDMGQLFFAYHDDVVVAAVFTAFFGAKALYKDGASVRTKTAPGISHLLQWEVMKWLKAHDKTSYDLHGTPHSSKIDDTAQGFYGIGRFKTSFSKDVIDYVGALDLPINSFRTTLWHKLVKRVIMRLYHRTHGYSWY